MTIRSWNCQPRCSVVVTADTVYSANTGHQLHSHRLARTVSQVQTHIICDLATYKLPPSALLAPLLPPECKKNSQLIFQPTVLTVAPMLHLGLQCCVRLSPSVVVVCDVMYSGKAVRPRAKVTIESPQEVVYKKSIGTTINDLDLCICRIKVMSTIMSHSPLNTSETVRDRGLVTKDHQQEMVCGVSNDLVTDDVT